MRTILLILILLCVTACSGGNGTGGGGNGCLTDAEIETLAGVFGIQLNGVCLLRAESTDSSALPLPVSCPALLDRHLIFRLTHPH